MEFQSPAPTSAAHPASGSTGGSLTQSEMLAELHAGRRRAELHARRSRRARADEGLESARVARRGATTRARSTPTTSGGREDGFRRANGGDLEEGARSRRRSPTPRHQVARARDDARARSPARSAWRAELVRRTRRSPRPPRGGRRRASSSCGSRRAVSAVATDVARTSRQRNDGAAPQSPAPRRSC